MAHALLRINFAGQDAQLVGATGLWPAPAANQTIAFRFLAYNALSTGSGVANEHGMQTNINYQHFWQFFSPDAGGTGLLGFGGGGSGGNNFATVPAGVPMRFEWLLTRSATGLSALVEIRVTNEATGQVFTNADFRSQWGEGPSVLVGRVLTFSTEMDGFRSYLFGASGSSTGAGVSVYVTGFAVCSDWCGANRAGEGN